MKRISLYTSEDAEKDVESKKRTGKEASIRKWKLVLNALRAIGGVQGSACGLCHERENGDSCLGCPLLDSPSKKCSEEDSDYWNARISLRKALDNAEKMVAALEALP